ncbi:hypothetical protein RP20_CCG004731 [Aedes albopictus]|nr:hypothetical protein RP20_CCG004731 [Aedes albopictus]
MYAEALLQTATQPQINLEILQYVISSISYLATNQHTTFNAVFLELCHWEPHDNFLGQLLKSTQLDHVPKVILTDAFEYTFEMHPNNPSLIVIHLGDRNIVKNLPKQFVRSLGVWDSSSRLLLLAKVNRHVYSVKLLTSLLYALKYYKVTTLELSVFQLLRYDTSGSFSLSRNKFADPDELFIDATRNMKGQAIRFSFIYPSTKVVMLRTGPIGPDIEWLKITAKHLNASLEYVHCPCFGDLAAVNTCFRRCLIDKNLSISLDWMIFQNLSASVKHRTLFNVATTSSSLMVPNGRPLNVVELFHQPFNAGTWIILFVVLGVMEIVKLLLPKHFINDPILLSICGIEKYNLHVAGQWEKICYFSLIVMTFLLTSAYEAKIIALMTERPSTQVIKTIEDLLKSNITIKIDLRYYLNLKDDPLIGQQVVNSSFDLDGVSAYYASCDSIKLILTWPSNYDLASKRKRYAALPENLRTAVGHCNVEVRSPLKSWFHWTQLVLFESGMRDKKEQATITIIHRTVRQFLHREGYKAFDSYDLIEFADFAPAWIAFGVGMIASGCVLLVELLHDSRKRSQTSTAWWI